MDDGPFVGEPVENCAGRKPDQSFKLDDANTILVFDRTSEEKAPSVALQTKDGKLRWCILATGYEKTFVSRLRFTRLSNPIPWMRPYARGWVEWTYGRERMTWSIDKDGTLLWYRYSW